jgi:hypothetical protein
MGVVNTPLPARASRRKRRLVSLSAAAILVLVLGFVVRSRPKPAPTVSPLLEPMPAKTSEPKMGEAFVSSPSLAESGPAAAPSRATAAKTGDDIDEFAKDLMNPKNGFYDSYYKIAGKFPQGWTMGQAPRWGKEETTISFHVSDHPQAMPALYYRIFPQPQPLTVDQAQASLRESAANKEQQRQQSLPDYVNGEMVPRNIGERPALTWTGTFTRNGEAWAEYLTRIYTPNGTFLFFMQAPAGELPALIPQFERVITTTIMP